MLCGGIQCLQMTAAGEKSAFGVAFKSHGGFQVIAQQINTVTLAGGEFNQRIAVPLCDTGSFPGDIRFISDNGDRNTGR